ncbi:MAG: MlaD family protein [Mycobacterium sp.]|nr:MlaD family protein [Mycobacterium sp.]
MMTAKKRFTVALAATVSLTTAGCATNGLASLPLPKPGLSRGSGYVITAVFENALNLPAFAKVRLAGADVGQLENLEAKDFTAVATMRIRDGVELPQGSTVELRSATPLGDVFIAVKPPENGSGASLLKNGDVIPIERTAEAATVENLLTGAAVLVNGGAVQNLTDLINGAGKAAGNNGGKNFRELVDKTNQLLGTMDRRTDQISDSLTALSGLSRRIDEKNYVLVDLMNAAAPATNVLAQHTNQIADLVVQAGGMTESINKFPSINGTDNSGRSVIADLNKISSDFNDVVMDPNSNLASINKLMPPVIKASSGSSLSLRGNIDRLVLGRIPDIGFAGDPGFSPLKWAHYNELIGSFQNTLYRLQERVVGRGPNVPQVPVIPSPTEAGQWQVVGPPPGPTAPGEFVQPAGPPPGPVPPPPPPVPAPAVPAPAVEPVP